MYKYIYMYMYSKYLSASKFYSKNFILNWPFKCWCTYCRPTCIHTLQKYCLTFIYLVLYEKMFNLQNNDVKTKNWRALKINWRITTLNDVGYLMGFVQCNLLRDAKILLLLKNVSAGTGMSLMRSRSHCTWK